MAFDRELAKRVRRVLAEFPEVEEKQMFGGIGFLVNRNMACGVSKNDLVVRVGPQRYTQSLNEPHASEFDFTGRPMKGWVTVDQSGCGDLSELRRWVLAGLEFAISLPSK